MNSLTIANAQLQHQKERPTKRVTYNPVTGLTDQVPAMPLDSALSSSSTNPVQNKAISEAVIDLTNKASHNAAGIENNARDISLLNERINNNVIAIHHNDEEVAALDNKVNTFSEAIEQNTRDIQKNAEDIAAVETDIKDISETEAMVRHHTVELAELTAQVNNNITNINNNSLAITNEATVRAAQDDSLAEHLSSEASRAQTAEDNNATAISDEVTRATSAEAALQQAINKLIPVGTVVDYWGTTDPDDWFVCDGRDTTGTDDELETNYPTLYVMLGNSNVLPDLRECVTVGAGKNETNIFDSTETNPVTGIAGTQAHDVYTIGEFKDDQFQGHQHEQYQATSDSKANWNNSYRISGWTWRDTQKIKDMADMTAARWGTTTHGKQVGCNKIIKAR